jgi:hypothetical protein
MIKYKKHKKEGIIMKKFVGGVVTGVMIAGSIAFAASYVAEPASFKVLVNGKEFVSDPPALVVEGRTYLPLRAMGDALGVPVVWNAELNQAEVGTTNTSTTANVIKTNDHWKMTYTGYKECTEVGYSKASDGKKFVIVNLEVENISDEPQNFSMLWLSTYFDDFKFPLTIIGEQIDGATMLAANSIEPGKKIKGYLAYEIDKDWNTLDIVYKETVDVKDDSNKIEFNISK